MSTQPVDPVAIAKLDDQTKQGIARWAEVEVSKAKVRSAIHSFTDLCFKKCITNASSDTLNTGESECIKNCVHRFLDTNMQIVNVVSGQSN